MNPVHILVDSFADEGLTNAQMGNAREIVRRLDPERFRVSIFHVADPDPAIVARPNTTLIPLPRRLQTAKILRQFLLGDHQLLFYVKPSPASRYYLRLPRARKPAPITVGTVESQSDLRNEATVAPEAASLWEKTVLRCDYLFSNSTAVKQSLLEEYGLNSEIVPTGVDTKFFTPAAARRENQRPRVLFVGSLRPFKQPQMLLEAAGRSPQADFVIAGDGPMLQQLRLCASRRNLANVVLLGPRTAEQLREDYRSSDVFLFPSSWEGSPKVLLEAAACGLPVIARQNYRPETVMDGQTGFLVGSDDELYSRLSLLLRNHDLRSTLGRAGRQHAERFDWDIITRQWEQVFERLIDQRVRAA